MSGPYAVVFWTLIIANVITPQIFWFKRMRMSLPVLFVVSIIVNIGMWLERFMIVVVSLHRDYMPSAWGMYSPTFWDLATFFGSVGMFLALMFLFIRVLPMISIFEMRELVGERK
jgi:molybdopterin-containing oxidoreductase family membrane subunit